jgi:hypothetical protein
MKKLFLIVLCAAFFSLSVKAEVIEDKIEGLLKEDAPDGFTGSNSMPKPTLLTNTQSRYSHLEVVKKTYYPDSSIHAHYNFEPKTWWVNCHKKNFDNMKVCSMSEGDLWVFLINGRYSVSVGSDHYPRSKGGLRIDNSSAIYGYEGEFSKSLSIIERLKKGKVAYTRYQEWPYEYNKDGEVSLKDFTKQFNEMLKQYRKL